MNNYFAYLHCKPDGTPFYVGKGLLHRVKNLSRNKYHSNVVKKYGAENILIGEIECSTEEIALELEKGLIKCLKASGVKLTNLTEGGEGVSGLIWNNEQRDKIRGVRNPAHLYRDRNNFVINNPGKSESCKERMRTSNPMQPGHKKSKDHSRKIAASLKAYYSNIDRSGENNVMFGKKHSEKTRDLIREKRKAQIITAETKLKMSESHKSRWTDEARAERRHLILCKKIWAVENKYTGKINSITNEMIKGFDFAPYFN